MYKKKNPRQRPPGRGERFERPHHWPRASGSVQVERAPKVDADEMRILTPQQVKDLPTLLHGHPLYAPALAALHTGMRRGELLPCAGAMSISMERSSGCAKHSKRPKPGCASKGRSPGRRPRCQLACHRARRAARASYGTTGTPPHARAGQAWRRCPRVSAVGQRCAAVAQRLRRDLEQRHQATQHRCLVSRAAAHLRQPTDRRKVPITIIAKRLGHSSPAIRLKVYAHLFREDDSEAAAAIDAVLGG